MMTWHDDRQAHKRSQKQLKKKLCLAVIAVVAFFLLVLFAGNSEGYQEIVYIEHTVSQGDTLWDIARQYKAENQDVREVVWQIREDNGLQGKDGAVIFPGQRLRVRNQ